MQEGIAIGRTFASIRDYNIDANKEMIAFGAMNVVGSCTSCYVATGKLYKALPAFHSFIFLVVPLCLQGIIIV
jgi:MFS superfamily sulfate permease-like transporter